MKPRTTQTIWTQTPVQSLSEQSLKRPSPHIYLFHHLKSAFAYSRIGLRQTQKALAKPNKLSPNPCPTNLKCLAHHESTFSYTYTLSVDLTSAFPHCLKANSNKHFYRLSRQTNNLNLSLPASRT